MICVFDIETIPDEDLIKKAYEIKQDGIEACKEAFRLQKEKSGNEFLPIVYHKVVSIAAVICNEYGEFQKVGNFPKNGASSQASEKELIESFCGFIEKHPKLVSFNGRGFDIPTIFIRAMKYNISCNAYFQSEDRDFNKTKWENYRSRYSERFHLDLLDSLSHYGGVRGLKLDVLCQALGIPGKFDVNGSDVYELYYDNKREQIDEYCRSDVLNTYMLYLKYEVLCGRMIIDDYKSILNKFLDKFKDSSSYSSCFVEYAEKEANKEC